RPADGGMCGNSHRLVDHDQIIVVVDHRELRDSHGHHDRSLPRFPAHVEPTVCCESIRLRETDSVCLEPAGLDDLCREAAGQPHQLRQCTVSARPRPAIRQRQAPGFHDYSACGSVGLVGTCLVPSSLMPLTERITKRPMLETMKMSATLKMAGKPHTW